MDLVNVITLALSPAALCVTVVFSPRQVRLMGYANQLPVVIEVFGVEELALRAERKSTARSYADVRARYFGRYRLGA